MSDIVDMILLGFLCQECGCYIDDDNIGYPRTCDFCKSVLDNSNWVDENE